MSKLDKFKPAVAKSVLLFLAGFIWICVGLMLLFFAFSWLVKSTGVNIYIFAGAGVIPALFAHHFGFLKIVDKNLKRLLLADEKRCLFSFIPWRSYLVIAVMITMGMILRHSAIPKHYLSVLYTCIGLALILSSVRYIRAFFREIRKQKKE